jgi:hypothetical protein
VRVRVVGSDGSFAPTGGAASFEVVRGRVGAVDLGTALAEENAALLVQSDVPLVAGVRWTTTGSPTRDLAFSAGAPVLDGPAVATGLRMDDGYTSNLLLTAAGGPATVRVQLLAGGVPSGAARSVRLAADTTVALPAASRRQRGVFSLLVSPVDGEVQAAYVRRRGVDGASGATISVLRPARVAVDVPSARTDQTTGVG